MKILEVAIKKTKELFQETCLALYVSSLAL
jgi:hypothetical protein